MGAIPDFSFPSMSKLLQTLDEEGKQVPKSLLRQVELLKKKLRKYLQEDHSSLEKKLEQLFPGLWQLRMQALPILLDLDLSEITKKIEDNMALLSQQHPELRAIIEPLTLGVGIMGRFAKQIADQNPEFLFNGSASLATNIATPTFQDVMASLENLDASEANSFFLLLHGSLMLELLLLAIDLAATEQLPMEDAMYHELKYLSSVATEDYALAAFGVEHTNMPWYKPPQNALQNLLLEGPTLSETDLQFINEKRMHLNSWR
jgi:hypothetical protein